MFQEPKVSGNSTGNSITSFRGGSWTGRFGSRVDPPLHPTAGLTLADTRRDSNLWDMKTLTTSIALLGLAALANGQTLTTQGAGNQGLRASQPKAWVWPMPGEDGQQWVINNYVDLDSGPGLLDYMGGTKTYNGHRGIDIDVPTFRAMDADFRIRAVEDGVVIGLDDAHYDRNTSCSGQWNFVTVLQDDGYTTIYGHLKQNSVVVSLGQAVTRGQKLGVVGSSGCSTAPHLHLETLDSATGALVDPFTEGLFGDPPIYDTAFSLMDVVIDDVPLATIPDILDPDPNITSIRFGETMGVGLSMAGGGIGDVVRFAFYEPNGSFHDDHVIAMTQPYRHHFWLCNMTLPEIIGTWRVDIELNGAVADSYDVQMVPSLGASRILRDRTHWTDLQTEFDYMVANNYRPIYRDGFESSGDLFFNTVYEQGGSVSWLARTNLDEAGLDARLAQIVADGWRPTHIESYYVFGQVYYHILAEDSPGTPWTVTRAMNATDHQANFNTLVGAGYRAKEISALRVNSDWHLTALYDQDAVGAWSAQAGFDSAGYQTYFNDQVALGRHLKYLNAFVDENGVARFSAIFDSVNPGGWAASHDIDSSTLNSLHDSWTNQGLEVQFVTGYESGGSENYGAVWSN